MEGSVINEPTLRRIPLYHQILTDLELRKEEYVSSKYLATFMRVDDAQVRKDVSIIGYRGKPKSGYSISGLRKAIGEYLGINYKNTAILIGAGKLGSALAEYPGFEEYGLKLVAIFDSSPERVGKVIGNFTILSVDSLPQVVTSYKIGIAIITVPKDAAQTVCDRIVELGIKAIWNFAPVRLDIPEDVTIRSENLAVGVAMLSHYLKMKKQELE
ncbi:MAG: redox-sensing transcriptional repressor Rex [Spirochaetales bacterium]|nr:redox-sensing transcriptional repressor Rex [Spirochaetales bacterium]